MLSKIESAVWLVVAFLVLGCISWAQSSDAADVGPLATTKTLTITIKGTIGPILSGSDPLGLDGKEGSLKLVASESLSPTKHSSTSATYRLPAGAITASAEKKTLSTKTPSTMSISLTKSADILTVIFAGKDAKFTDTTFLKPDSWTTAVLKHPGVFTPSPQDVTSAKTAGGPGCQVLYTVDGTTTVLGFSGTASNSDPADPVLPDFDPNQYLDQ
jgi:hypothetical protein